MPGSWLLWLFSSIPPVSHNPCLCRCRSHRSWTSSVCNAKTHRNHTPVDVQSRAGPPNPVHVTSRMPRHMQPRQNRSLSLTARTISPTHACPDIHKPQNPAMPPNHQRCFNRPRMPGHTYRGRTAPLHTTVHAVPPTHACPGIRNLTHQVRSATPASSSTRLRIPGHTQPVKPRNVPARNRVPSRANPTLIHPTHRIFTVDMGVITIQKINRPASPCCC